MLLKHLLFSALLSLLKPLSIHNGIQRPLVRKYQPEQNNLKYYIESNPPLSLRESLINMTCDDSIESVINPAPTLSWKNRQGKDYSYDITAADKISLFRACAHEGSPQYAVCWSLLQRFSFIYPKYKNITSFVKAYVQPINPTWFMTGKKHLAYVDRLRKRFNGDELQKKIKDAERRAKNRKRFASAPVKNEEYISVVEDILNFKIASPNESIVHYCASFATIKQSEEEAHHSAQIFGNKRGMIAIDFGQSFLPGTNWFFAVPKSSNFRLQIL